MKEPDTTRLWPTIAMIAATYVFFLLFAEFALLRLMMARAADPAALRGGLAWLGGGGALGCLLAGWIHNLDTIRRALALGFGACALAALLAALGPAALPLPGVALLTGLGLGWLTVHLAGALPHLLAGSRLGLWTGAGTGLAYAFCNLPAVFTASPVAHAWIAAAVAGLGALAATRLTTAAPAPPLRPELGGRRPFWALLGVIVALVWLDSAAFLLIQERPALRALAWETAPQLWSNAFVHLTAALLAGWLLDRGLLRFVLGLAGFDLLVGAWALAQGGPLAARLHAAYPAGVSLYSAALVALPALSRDWSGVPRGAWRATWLYLFAGWLGSALGIGLALDQRTIPVAFLAGAGVALAALLYLSRRGAVALAVLVLLLVAPNRSDGSDPSDPAITAGREVYIAEGCIHCHSQFVRPGTRDEQWWGPARPLADTLAGEPPLPGNRRQGPDLQNVGNRRSADWNRVHLENPRALSPGSIMPAYGPLFRDGDPRGPNLLAYLASLGADTVTARLAQIAAWSPSPQDGDAVRGAGLFRRLCAACHGDDGRGRGPLAARLAQPPANLRTGPWPRTARPDPVETRAALARIIVFGVPGTAMAGHETLPEADIAALTAEVQRLRLPGATP